MPLEVKTVTWLLIMLLQKRELPWPTLYLVEATITAHARLSRYSSCRKRNWSDDQWVSFLEKLRRLDEDCRAALETFDRNNDFAELNASLEDVRRGLIEAESEGDEGRPSGGSEAAKKPADVRSITWLLRSFTLRPSGPRPHHAIIHLLFGADAQAFSLRTSAAEGGRSDAVEAYDRLYRECERCIALFLEDSDMKALTLRFESILQQLGALGLPKV